jgi:hypothetical protein
MGYNVNQSRCGVAILDGNTNAAYNFIVGLHGKKPIEAQHTNTTSPLHVVFLQNLPNLWQWRETSFITNTTHSCEWPPPLHSDNSKSQMSLLYIKEHCMMD